MASSSQTNHGRFVPVTASVKHDFHYVGHDWKNHRQHLLLGFRQWASLFNKASPDSMPKKSFDTPVVVRGGKTPPGAGYVSQSGDNNGTVCCLHCSTASFRPWRRRRMDRRCTDAINGLDMFSDRQRVRHCDDQYFHGCHVLDSGKKWWQLCWATSSWVDEDDLRTFAEGYWLQPTAQCGQVRRCTSRRCWQTRQDKRHRHTWPIDCWMIHLSNWSHCDRFATFVKCTVDQLTVQSRLVGCWHLSILDKWRQVNKISHINISMLQSFKLSLLNVAV